jgi:hypothetical protein
VLWICSKPDVEELFGDKKLGPPVYQLSPQFSHSRAPYYSRRCCEAPKEKPPSPWCMKIVSQNLDETKTGYTLPKCGMHL